VNIWFSDSSIKWSICQIDILNGQSDKQYKFLLLDIFTVEMGGFANVSEEHTASVFRIKV
jgi:hypothetical protein